MWQLLLCRCGASTLTRGRVCNLQFLRASPMQSFSDWSRVRLVTIFYCLELESPPTARARSSHLYPTGIGWPSNHRHWVPRCSQSHSYITTVDQSECRGFEPTLGLVTRYFFLSEGWCLEVAVLLLWDTLSDERPGLSFVRTYNYYLQLMSFTQWLYEIYTRPLSALARYSRFCPY
jgi:hypothetical protein